MSKRRLILLALGLGVLVVIALVVLALPFRGVPSHAEAARAELTTAAQALRGQDIDVAREHIELAREHVDDVTAVTEGIGGDVWSLVPVAGADIRDLRHLGRALDRGTSVAEAGVEAAPLVTGKTAALFGKDHTIDLDVLEEVLGHVRTAGEHLAVAASELDAVDGDGMAFGDRLVEARDAAGERIYPLHRGLERMQPLLDSLPGLLGADGERKYVVAMLNPTELRFSGGAPLSIAPFSAKDGKVALGRMTSTETRHYVYGRTYFWRKVKGNPFHLNRTRISNATFAPSWSVSGEELLNAWRSLRGRNGAGMIAVDVVALARMLDVTGPIEVAGYGEVTGANLVEKVVGSYDDFALDPLARHGLNDALIPAFMDHLFSGTDLVGTFRALGESADGRHLAMFFRNDEVQEAITELGFAGDLSDTAHDYIGAFTQNTVASKVDYWQTRAVRSDVRLAEDGSAEVELSVTIHNDSPPYPFPGGDPGTGYATRISNQSLGIFMPVGAEDVTFVEGAPSGPPGHVGDFFGRPFVRSKMTLPQGDRHTVTVRYRVPQAATVGDDGELRYQLDADPQGMIRAQALDVRLRLPEGFAAESLPEGWKATPRGARLQLPDLTGTESWTITANP